MREYAEILPIYEKRWAERPDSFYFLPLANAYRAAGWHQQAIETLKQGLEHHPDYLGARAALAAAYFGADLFAEAEEEIEHVLSAQPENLLVRELLVACQNRVEREEEAQLVAEAPPEEEAEEVLAVETPPFKEPPAEPPKERKGLELGPALEMFVDDANAVEEIHSLFLSEPTPEEEPPEEEPAADVAATLEGWLDALERRRG